MGLVRVIHTNPFNTRRQDVTVLAGSTVSQYMEAIGLLGREGLVVYSGEQIISRSMWGEFKPDPGTCLAVVEVPYGEGGDAGKILKTVAMIAVVVVATWATGPGGLALTGAWQAGAVAATTTLAALALNALIPPVTPETPQQASPTYSVLGSRNELRPYGVVPRIYGKHKYYPPLAATPYFEADGEDQYYVMLLDCGYGPLKFDQRLIRIGETSVGTLRNIELEMCGMGVAPTLYRNTMDVQTVNASLLYNSTQTVTSGTDADEILLLIVAAGLVEFDEGRRYPTSVEFEISYREYGTAGPWLTSGIIPHQTTEGIITKTSEEGWRQIWTTSTEVAPSDEFSFQVAAIPANHRVDVTIAGVGGGAAPPVTVGESADPQTVQITPVAGRVNVITITYSALQVTGEWGGSYDTTTGEWGHPAFESLPTISSFTYGTAETSGIIAIVDQRETLVRRTIRIKPPETSGSKQYDITITRLTPDSGSQELMNATTLTQVQTVTYGAPVSQTVIDTHELIAIRVKASGALQGQLDQFNVVATALLPVYSGSAWETRETKLAAWAYAHELRGGHNAAQLADSRLDLTALKDWADADTEEEREFNYVFDGQSTIGQNLRLIAAAGRARFSMPNGKYGVIRDTLQSIPAQIFTPRNSWSFKGKKTFFETPHAYRVQFINEDVDWIQDERLVPVDGYTEETATVIDDSLSFPGVTNATQIAKAVYYHFANLKLRPEIYEFWTDVQHIRCTRGDLVRVSHDVPMWGLKWGRIKSTTVDGLGKTTAFVLDETVTFENGKTYAVNVRLSSSSVVTGTVTGVFDSGETYGDTKALTFASPLTGPSAGDLVQFGEADSISADLIIKEIVPGYNMEAQILAVDYAPDAIGAESATVPPFDSQITIPPPLNRPAPTTPVIDDLSSVALRGEDGVYTSQIVVTFTQPNRNGVTVEWIQSQYRRYVSPSSGALDEAGAWTEGPLSKPETGRLIIPGIETNADWEVRVRAISTLSVASSWATSSLTTVADTTPPGPVTGLDSSFTDRLVFFWTPPTDKDLNHYHCTINNWANTKDVTGISAEVLSITSRTVTFKIKAVDHSGNVGDAVSKTVTLSQPGVPSTSYLNRTAEWNLIQMSVDGDFTLCSGHKGFLFQWSIDGSTWTNINSFPTENATLVIPWSFWASGVDTIPIYIRYAEADAFTVALADPVWSGTVEVLLSLPVMASSGITESIGHYWAAEAEATNDSVWRHSSYGSTHAFNGTYVYDRTIGAMAIAFNAIMTEHLDARAWNKVFNWSSQKDDPVPGWTPVPTRASETVEGRASNVVTSTGAIVSDAFKISAGRTYKFTISGAVASVTGTQKISIKVYADSVGSDETKGSEIGAYTMDLSASGPVRAWGSLVTTLDFFSGSLDTSYTTFEGYLMAMNSDPEDTPEGRNVDNAFKLPPDAAWVEFILDGGAATASWFSPSVQDADGGVILAHRVQAAQLAALSAYTGTLTVDSLGWVKSGNYVAGVSGFAIYGDGTCEFNEGSFRGAVIYGNITGAPTSLADINAGEGTKLSGISDGADVTQTVIDGGLVTTGTIEVKDGADVTKAGMTGDVSAGNAVRIWAGDTKENRAVAPFRVDQEGNLTATKASIQGTAHFGNSSLGFLVSIGKALKAGSVSETNPDLSDFDNDGQLHMYKWNDVASTDTWEEILTLGLSFGDMVIGAFYALAGQIAIRAQSPDNDAIVAVSGSGKGINAQSDDVWAGYFASTNDIAIEGTGKLGGKFSGGTVMGNLELPHVSISDDRPTDAAAQGTIRVIERSTGDFSGYGYAWLKMTAGSNGWWRFTMDEGV